MKILFAGGGTGGHVTPIIAIAEEINRLADEEHLLDPRLYFMSDKVYDERELFENGITFVHITAGKWRRHFSLKNFFDLFKIGISLVSATLKMFSIYPDLVVGKGGYASFPALFAARLLRIPVILHDSDVVPSRANAWAREYASKVGIAWREASEHWDHNKIALVGVPIRHGIKKPVTTGAREYLGLEDDTPVILVLGGSSGAERINDTILAALPELLNKYQVIHQVGGTNLETVNNEANLILENHPHKSRYRTFGFLSSGALSMAAGVSRLVITRAGSTTLFEIANWGLPSIVIPIPEDISHDQTKNALAFARAGGGILMEEKNLTANLLNSEVDRLFNNPDILAERAVAAKKFAKPDAAEKMARVIIEEGLKHEK